MKFSQHDIVVWHAYTGDMKCRVIHVYDQEPKTLLLTDNIDDETGFGKCFHAAQVDCEFISHGEDITKSQRGRYKTKSEDTPLHLTPNQPNKEDTV